MRTQLVDFLGLASVEVVVSRLLFCYPLVVVCVCSVVVNVKFMECVMCSNRRGRRGGSFFSFFFLVYTKVGLHLEVCLCLSFVHSTFYYAVPS